jgi:hypothetical protein
MIKLGRIERAILSMALSVAIILNYGFAFSNLVYAEEYELFDSCVPGGGIQKATQIIEDSAYMTEFPAGTTEIKFYAVEYDDEEVERIKGRDEEGNKKFLTKDECQYEDGWWTIDLSSGYFDMSRQGGANYFENRNLETPDWFDYDAYQYYALDLNPQNLPLVIRVEKSSEPEEYERYDSRLITTGSTINKPSKLNDLNYLVKYSYGTDKIQFYLDKDTNNNEIKKIYYRDESGNQRSFTREDCQYSDGWWTVDLSSGYFDMEKWDSRYVEYMTGESQDPYSKYYLIYAEDAINFVIQVGHEGDPLPVCLINSDNIWQTEFLYTEPTELSFGTVGRDFMRVIPSGQDIYYTIDTTDPKVSETALKYDGNAILFENNTIVKARTKVGNLWGEECEFGITVRPLAPTATLRSGTYFGEQTIELMHVSKDSKIYYTLDGSEPDDHAALYDEAIHIDSDTTLKAVAYVGEMSPSTVLTEVYSFTNGLSLDLKDNDQGTWMGKQLLATQHRTWLFTPYGMHSCDIIANVPENSVLMVNGSLITRAESGDFEFTLAAKTIGSKADEKELKKAANTISVTTGNETVDYTVYCIEACCDGLPDKVLDYFCIGSQYTNTLLFPGSSGGYGGNVECTLAGGSGEYDSTSLGNFGGYAIWYYKNGISNDPKNPYGVDFIVIGNSYDGTNEFAEPGNVLVSEDGKEWYSLAGSLHYDSSATWDQGITYSQSQSTPGMTDYDLKGVMTGTLDEYAYPLKNAYPLHNIEDDFQNFTTSGTLLHAETGTNSFGNTRPSYPAFGYADVGYSKSYSNEAENPYGGLMRAGMVNYKGYEYRILHGRNGDGFDLAWAVDEDGKPVSLDTVHYVKIQTATCIKNSAIGEKSTEICCIRTAKADDSNVGVTEAPSSIAFDGIEISGSDLVSGAIRDVNVNGIFDVKVNAPEEANVYINSINNDTAFMNEAPHGIVRIIVQEGNKAPVIYYFKVNQTEQPSSRKVTKITLNATDGLLHDKTKLICYLDEETLDHLGGDAKEIVLDEPDPERATYAFFKWIDADNKTITKVNSQFLEKYEDITLLARFGNADEVRPARVIEMIDALPDIDDIKADDADDVRAAMEAYDALSEDDKAQIEADKVLKLKADVVAIEKIEAEAVVADLQAQLKKAQDDLKDAKDKVKELEGAVSTLQGQLKDAQDAVTEAQNKYDTLKAESDADKAELAQAKADLAAAKAAEKDAKERLEKAQTDLTAAQSKVTELEGKVSGLVKDLAAEKAKAETAKIDADKYEEELAILKAQNAILKKTVKKVKAKAKGTKAIVSWKSVGKGFKYEVYRSTNPTKSFKKVKTAKKLKVTVKKLKKGKTYYFKVRAFKTVGGKKVYTSYSNIAKAKIKK